ncbi:MAG: fatty-acid--CoA ligase [Acidimicrobiia bacterium]
MRPNDTGLRSHAPGAPAAALAAETVCEAFQITASSQPPSAPALRAFGADRAVTWGGYAQRVRAIAGGLHEIGMRSGDTLATMLVNRPEFNLVDTATMHLGVASFSIYNTLPTEQIAYQLENSGARVVVTEPQFLDRVLAARAPSVRAVVLVEGAHEDAITLAGLEAAEPADFDFDATWRGVRSDDILALIYTSGTTGPPKGVELTHANVQATSRGFASRVPPTVGGRVLSFLPAAHVAERFTTHYLPSIGLGATITTIASLADLPLALREVRPTVLMAVARVLEKLRAGLGTAGITDPATLDDASRQRALAIIGFDELQWIATGGGPISPDLVRFFTDLGITTFEVWGMSETTGIACTPPWTDIRVGTAGPALPDAELALADDGELLVRGPQVMRGYRNDPERTAEAFDADGWLRTGDIATIDGDGYVKIIDRKKEIIINSAGKNMSPANIEHHLKAASPLIGQAVCIGDGRLYNVALLVLDPDVAGKWAAERGRDAALPSLADDDELIRTIAAAVEAANAHLARVEQIKKFEVLPEEWLPAGDELTPTSKLKRRAISEKYAAVIERLYAS